MLTIAICDDMMPLCTQLETIVANYASSINEHFNIEIYYSGKNLCEDIKNEKYFDLIFLDIEMSELNGIGVGKYIRDIIKDNDMAIVYVSSHVDYAMELFQIRPFDFLVKPINKEKVESVIKKYIEVYSRNPSVFNYGTGKSFISAYIRDILYFTIKGRVIEMITVYDKKIFYGNLKNIANELQKQDFFYANRSQLVNYNRIREFYYDRLIMEDKNVINIAQGRRKEIQEKFQNQNK